MNATEARELVKQINNQVEGTRTLLLRLRDEEGWRSLGYDSWRDCATKEFKLGASYVYRLVDAAQVQKSLPKESPVIKEAVARELTKLPEPKQAEAYQEAVKRSDGKAPTAKVVREVVRENLPDEEPIEKPITKPPKGGLTPKVQAALDGREDFLGIVRDLQASLRQIKKLKEKPHGQCISVQACEASLHSTWVHLRSAMPHAPCPACAQKGCRKCRMQGWISEFDWKNTTETELKAKHAS